LSDSPQLPILTSEQIFSYLLTGPSSSRRRACCGAVMVLVGHADADCFYVSCERVRTPALRHQAAGVLGNQGACVIARSYEMRPFGVRVGMPIWDAVKLCPHGIYIKRDFRWYEILSRLVLDTLRQVSPAVEYYSIDEMFFDAGALEQAFRLPLLDAIRA